MKEYPKIDTIFKRTERGQIIVDDYACPEFEYLKDNKWVWTEKIDGTNIRIMYYTKITNAKHYAPYDGYDHFEPILEFGGKTDEAQIPAKLINNLRNMFTIEKMQEIFGPAGQNGKGLDTNVCLYGEGYGAGIQKGGGNYNPEQKFILFDVKIGDWWLKRPDIEDIANKLGLDIVTVLGERSLVEIVNLIKMGPVHSPQFPLAQMEGLVGTPKIPLFNRKGERIITKIKYKDFAHAL